MGEYLSKCFTCSFGNHAKQVYTPPQPPSSMAPSYPVSFVSSSSSTCPLNYHISKAPSLVILFFLPSINRCCVSSYKPLTPLTSTTRSQLFICNPEHSENSGSVISILCWTSLLRCHIGPSNGIYPKQTPSSFPSNLIFCCFHILMSGSLRGTVYPNQRSKGKKKSGCFSSLAYVNLQRILNPKKKKKKIVLIYVRIHASQIFFYHYFFKFYFFILFYF